MRGFGVLVLNGRFFIHEFFDFCGLIRVLYLTVPFFLGQVFCPRGEKGLPVDPAKAIRDADFVFENTPIKIVANRDSPEIDLPGVKVGPFKEGKEYEVRFWIAQELKKSGIAHIREEEPLDLKMLNKIQWKEGFQTAQRVTALPEDFYPKLRRYLEELNEEAIKKPEARENYEKAKKLADDITRTRLKKIVSLASAPTQTRQILGNLTEEELILYNHLHNIIGKWRNRILKTKGGNKT
jgi:predicted DNA-binding antitoxin AbrB/MazE fold protein